MILTTVTPPSAQHHLKYQKRKHSMKESDWKKFKTLKEIAIDNFCRASLLKSRAIMDDDSLSAHERYLKNYRFVIAQDKKMASIFDGHSRSRATEQLLYIRSNQLIDETLLTDLSEELQSYSNPNRFAV
jgi:hypothetical protein